MCSFELSRQFTMTIHPARFHCRVLFFLRLQTRTVISESHCHRRLHTVTKEKPTKWSYSHGPSDTPLLGKTIGHILQERVEAVPGDEAIIVKQQNVRKTFSQLLDECDQLAAGLLSMGLKKGDRLGIWGPNSYEWILTQYATARVGIILVNVNPNYLAPELQYALRKVGCKALIMAQSFKDQNYYEILLKLIPELATAHLCDLRSHLLPDLRIVATMSNDKYQGVVGFHDILEAGTSTYRRHIMDIQNSLQFDDPINIQFTSGTTGRPKGATLSHHNIVNNCYFTGRRMNYHKEKTTICIPVPLYHCFGMVLGSLCAPVHGAKCVFPSQGFEAGSTLKTVAEERCTSLYGVPTMFIDMLNHHDFDTFDLSSLRTGIMGGAPCPLEVAKQLTTVMHMPDISSCYGSTETSPLTIQSSPGDSIEARTATAGRSMDHVEVKIIDQDGNIVPVGTTGELCTRGFTTMLGYWGDPDKTAEAIKPDRWYHSGDLAKMDEGGYFTIMGRRKDMIIRGGENIYPMEIEQVLYQHASVKDVQVIGVPDKRLGEEVCAWIQLKDGRHATSEEIQNFCKEKMARYKVPKYVRFVESFPLTVTGKVQKFKIKEEERNKLNFKIEDAASL